MGRVRAIEEGWRVNLLTKARLYLAGKLIPKGYQCFVCTDERAPSVKAAIVASTLIEGLAKVSSIERISPLMPSVYDEIEEEQIH